MSHLIVGAYAAVASGAAGADSHRITAGIVAPGLADGLELPFFDRADEPWFQPRITAALPSESGSVVTLIPALFAAAKADPSVGLASDDPVGRGAAVAIVERARRAVAELNAARPGTVIGVELQSSPGGQRSSAPSFLASLIELRERDWRGAQLLIEHCDAPVAGRAVQKGFLPLEDEIDIAARLDLGIVINWGRSVIETRDPSGAEEHLRLALEAGRLRGLMLSGVAPVDTPYGPAWSDVHVPPATECSGSLLDAKRLAAAVAAARSAPELLYLGAKYAVAPGTRDDERVALLRRELRSMRAS